MRREARLISNVRDHLLVPPLACIDAPETAIISYLRPLPDADRDTFLEWHDVAELIVYETFGMATGLVLISVSERQSISYPYCGNAANLNFVFRRNSMYPLTNRLREIVVFAPVGFNDQNLSTRLCEEFYWNAKD